MTEPTRGPITMRRGMLWLTAGSALLVGTYTLSTNAVNRVLAYGLLIAGLYLIVLGVEKMIGGYLSGARAGDPAIVRSARRTGAIGLLLAAILVSAGYAAYATRSRYWESIEILQTGADTGIRFFDIIEGHTQALEAGLAGQYGLERWRESAEAGLAMREEIMATLEAARYLAEHAGGDLGAWAGAYEPFYTVCAEWIGFYERIDRSFEEESMIEPKEEWAEEHERLHQKLHDVQPHPAEGS